MRSFESWHFHAPVSDFVNNNNPFSLRGYFAGPGNRHDAARNAYQALETILQKGSHTHAAIQEAAAKFRSELIAALKASD